MFKKKQRNLGMCVYIYMYIYSLNEVKLHEVIMLPSRAIG